MVNHIPQKDTTKNVDTCDTMYEGIFKVTYLEPRGRHDRICFCLFVNAFLGFFLKFSDTIHGLRPGIIVIFVTLFPAVECGDGDRPVFTDFYNRACSPGVVIEDGERTAGQAVRPAKGASHSGQETPTR